MLSSDDLRGQHQSEVPSVVRVSDYLESVLSIVLVGWADFIPAQVYIPTYREPLPHAGGGRNLRRGVKTHRVRQLSQPVENFYNGQCFEVQIEKPDNLEEVFRVLDKAYKEESNIFPLPRAVV